MEIVCFFKKMGQPRPLFRLFSVFSNKHYKFLQQIREKMSIQYMVLVFEPTTFGRESPPITTRPVVMVMFFVKYVFTERV